jgi:hypothetical protein
MYVSAEVRQSLRSVARGILRSPERPQQGVARCSAPVAGAGQVSQDGVGQRLRGALGGTPRDGRWGNRQFMAPEHAIGLGVCSRDVCQLLPIAPCLLLPCRLGALAARLGLAK